MRQVATETDPDPACGRSDHSPPDLRFEQLQWRRGLRIVAGLDEVGRGPLAGPVVAAAVVLDPHSSLPWAERVRDSKQLSPAVREELAALIWRHVRTAGVGVASAAIVDRVGIVEATRLAMTRAVANLAERPEHLLLDAIELPAQPTGQTPLVHGDARSLSIACASIIAKVARDRMLRGLERRYPGYGFARHKGYGTAAHLAALARLGGCPLHRRTFAPVAAMQSCE